MVKKILAIALMLIALCACGEKPEDKIVPVASVTLSQPEAEMKVGETLQLKAQISPSNATEQNVVWASSKQSVATVSDAGLVTAVGAGTTNITATVDGKSATCKITVVKPEVPVVHVESVTLDKTDAQLEIGGTLTLTATVLPDDADDKSVEWKSSNPAIAEVDQSGKITAVSSGAVTITVTTIDGNKMAACELTVKTAFIPVESITFEHDEYIAHLNDSYPLQVTVLPENATDKTITWSSSNPDIVSVTQEGIVTGHGDGEVTITARAGDKEATCTIFAIGTPQPPTEQYDGEENGHRYVDLGLPSGIKWATRNVGAPSPEDYGGYYAWGETSTKSNYGTENYSVQGKYSMGQDNLTELLPADDAAHIVMGGNWYIPTREEVQELLDNCTFESIDMKNGSGYKVVSKRNGKYFLLPAAGSITYDVEEYVGGVFFYWTSSVNADRASEAWNLNTYNNELVVDGRVRFRGCPIRAITGRPVVSVESVSLDQTHVDLHPNEQITLVATVLPENATDKSITWASTNPAIAEVDQQGNVTAKSVGTVTITATTTDGGKVAGCEVTVAPGIVAIQSVAIEPSSISMKVGETALFSIIVTPSNADVFSTRLIISGDSGVLKWGDMDGTQKSIVALSQGSAAVTVTLTGDGGERLSATCNVTVIEDPSYIPVDYLVFEEPSIEMIIGDTRSLSVTIFPDDATNQTVTWSSSNNNVVTVNESGMLTAVSAGKASITAMADGKSNSINVTVSDGIVPVESISLDEYDILLRKGASQKLTATVLPDNATNKTLTWSSDDTGVAKVDALGRVTGVDAGTTWIRASAGNEETSCRVTVIAIPERIDLNATELTMTKGERFTLVGKVFPANANDTNVYYYADNSYVVMVGERTGEVYANKLGTGVVTAKNLSSGITATCTVTVVAAGPPAIILEQDSFTVDAAQSGDIRIPVQLVNTDGSSLQAAVSTGANWLGARVVGNGVTFYVSENRSTLSRTGTITITYSTASATVTVIQRGKTPTGPPDIVFDDQFDPNANNGVHYSGEYDNVFYARVENPVEGVELQMKADVPWITNLRPTSNENWYCFTPTMNTTGRERTGHVILTYGSVTKTIKFVQQAGDVTIILNPGDMTVNYAAQTVSFEVTLPDGYDYNELTAELDDYINWVTDVAISGRTVSFKVKENNNSSYPTRSARIKVSLGDQASYFNVNQTYDAPVMTVLHTEMTLSYERQMVPIPVNITNPRATGYVDVQVPSGYGWIYASPADENGNPQITVLANETGSDRTVTLELSYGSSTATVRVTQTTSSTTISVTESASFDCRSTTYAFSVLITDPQQYVSLDVDPDVRWIEVNSVREASATRYDVVLTIKKNRARRSRTGNVVFTYGVVSKTMVITQGGDPNIPEGFVDLGLSSGTLWAEKNLGAANDYNFGNYYAWGEIATKSKYTWFNYKWASGSKPWENLTKYNASDGKKTLDPADDAATVANSQWTTPTSAQWEELYNECQIEWVTSPVEGVMVYSADGYSSIFLPATGSKFDNEPVESSCSYWSKSINNNPDVVIFAADANGPYLTNGTRCFGMPVRPVWKQ